MEQPSVDLLGDTSLEGAVLEDTVTGERSTLRVSGLFVTIGHVPNTDLLKGQIDLDDQGYLRTVPGRSLTDVDGIFGCGDVQNHIYHQAITAAGSGCMAAINVGRGLENHTLAVGTYQKQTEATRCCSKPPAQNSQSASPDDSTPTTALRPIRVLTICTAPRAE
jgi:Pyridine nucleotide-disulphide oxidoreductase